MNVLVGSDASPHNNRDTNGSYRCPREKIQTHELKKVVLLQFAPSTKYTHTHTLCHHDFTSSFLYDIGL